MLIPLQESISRGRARSPDSTAAGLPAERAENAEGLHKPSARAGLRVAHVLYSFDTGGLEKGIATVARYGSPEFEHVIVCLTHSGASERLLPPGSRILELGKPPGNSPVFLRRLCQILKDLQPDVVHTRNWSGMDGIIAARLAGIRRIVHGEHGWGMGDVDGRNRKRLFIRRILLNWTLECTCVSKAIQEWLQNEVKVRRPVNQIYNGVDTELFRPYDGEPVRAELGIGSSAFVVGTVGRLDPIKDHPTLFSAFRKLQAKVPDVVLLVIGDGPERSRLQPLAGDGVRLLGNRFDVRRLIRAFDVFVLASRNEGISNTILEAMATGLPVVATRVGGSPELVRHGSTGMLVPSGDPSALADALMRYVHDRSLGLRHGLVGRKQVELRFSIDNMVTAYQAVWRRVSERK